MDNVMGKCFTCAKVITKGYKYCMKHIRCSCGRKYLYNKYWPNDDGTKGIYFCLSCNIYKYYHFKINKIKEK